MQEIKITTKLLISIALITLFFMFWFELAYNHLMYKDYAEVYEKVITMEKRVDMLIEVNMKLQNYIINKEVRNE